MAESSNKPFRGPVRANDRKANRRGAARLAAVQALYQMDIAGAGINDVLAEFESHWLGSEVEGEQYLPAEAAFFRDIVSGVVRDQTKIDPVLDTALERGWPLQPAKVVVSEYVDIAHAFVERDETGMVNAVLEQLARQYRADEMGPK